MGGAAGSILLSDADGRFLPFAGRIIAAARLHRAGRSRIAQHFHSPDDRSADEAAVGFLDKYRGVR